MLWGKQVPCDGEELVVQSVGETEGQRDCAQKEGMGLWALCEGKSCRPQLSGEEPLVL